VVMAVMTSWARNTGEHQATGLAYVARHALRMS
jgi:hypothetical protein